MFYGAIQKNKSGLFFGTRYKIAGWLAGNPYPEDADTLREGAAEGSYPPYEPLPTPAADVTGRCRGE